MIVTAAKPQKLPRLPKSALFPKICRARGLPIPAPELRFHPTRKWRFDFAFPEQKVALEVQGGVWTNGRHTRGAALLKEHEKLGHAAALGWRVLFCTPADLNKVWIYDLLREALSR